MTPKLVQNIYPRGDFNQVIQPEKRPGIPRCPLPNATAHRLFGRTAIIDEIVARLSADGAIVAISAVRGLPGVGKTDLVRAIGCDERIVAHFAGGVLYAELGPTPDASQILRRWLIELDRPIPQTDDAGTLAAVVRQALAERPALLILDDVWPESLAAARALRECATTASRILASSRNGQTARDVARGQPPLELPVLDDTPALDLLRQHAPGAVQKDEEGAQQLAAALGNLPLALKLAGRLLENDRRHAQPCAHLLQTWQQRLDELRDGNESRPGLTDPELSLDAIIGLSYTALPDDTTRTAAAALSVFGSTPLDWDWEAMAAVWGGNSSTEKKGGKISRWISRLVGQKQTQLTKANLFEQRENAIVESGLLDFDSAIRRYSLHQTVQAFFASRCTDVVYMERHARYYAELMKKCNREISHESTIDAALATLDREIGQMEWAQQVLMESTTASWHDEVLISFAFSCITYFNLRGRYQQGIDWCEVGCKIADQRGQQQNVGGHLNNIAGFYEVTGRYEDAIDAYNRSLELKKKFDDEKGQARTLNNLGIVYRLLGSYNDAITLFQQSLEIKQRMGDISGTAQTLVNLSTVYAQQGHYDNAIALYQQSLEITHRIGNIASSATILGNLGNVYKRQGRYDDAIVLYRQSLDISERIRDLATSANQYWNLGTLYVSQGDLAAALPLIEKNVLWKEQIGHPDAVERRKYLEDLRAKLNNQTQQE